MKKYLLLFTLFCATFAMGTLLYNAAHQNTSIASISDDNEMKEGFFLDRATLKESKLEEDGSAAEGLVEMSKEVIKDASESMARFIFSLIYK
jgi:hypothetical protein